jgi:uncharacterized membrane protein HdeD (DUF308 family)
MSADLTRNWWVVTLRGVAGVLFGLLAFFWPGITLASLVLLFGAYIFVDGVFTIAAAVRSAGENERWGMLLFEGVLGVIGGILTFILPIVTALALLYVVAGWSIVTGILGIATAVRLRRVIEGEWLLGLSGALSVIFGVLLVIRPAAGAVALVWMIGSYAFVFGALMIGLGFRLRGLAPEGQTRAAA